MNKEPQGLSSTRTIHIFNFNTKESYCIKWTKEKKEEKETYACGTLCADIWIKCPMQQTNANTTSVIQN